MSESKKIEFLERTLTADPNRFKSAPASYPDANLSAYQKKVRRDQSKTEAKRQERREQSAPYTKPPSKTNSLSKDEELALAGLTELQNKREVSDVKEVLNITPSKPVPEGANPFLYTPAELNRSEMREEFIMSQPNALNFNDEIDMGFDLNEEVNEKGGRKRRKSRKLRKSSKKSRKSKRKTTRKVRRHRRRH